MTMVYKYMQRGHWPNVSRFYGTLKIPLKYEQRYFIRTNSLFPALILCDSTGRIARALVDESVVFSC
jgi:hypothetical protein